VMKPPLFLILDTFRVVLANLKRQCEDGVLMRNFEEL